jgi:flagellar hook-associated protein 3 FlgL
MLSSFYPVVAGRVSDASSRHRSLYQVQVGRIAIQDLERQLSTGQRFSRPSDDPTAALRVIGLQREMEFRDQTARNLDSAQGYLNASESTLSNVQDLLTEFRGLGIEASGNLAGEADVAGWVNQIETGIHRLAAAANTKYLDRYLFTGGVVTNPTLTQSNTAVLFQGNDLALQSVADQQDYLTHNVTGFQAFGLISQSVDGSASLNPAAVGSTRLADLNVGRGVSPGAIEFSNGTEEVIIDLSDAEFVQDVVNKVNESVSLDGRAIQASIVNGSLVVDYADGNPGTIRISEVGTGRTAKDLGIASTTPAPVLPITSTPLQPIVRPTTALSQLNGGVGFNWSEGFQIRQGGKSFSIDFTGAQTVEDALNAINRSGASVIADVSPDSNSLRIRSTASGQDFSIAESGGTLASTLGLKTFHAQTQLSELNYGRGVQFGPTNDLRFTRNDGTTFEVDLGDAITVQDVLDRINNHVDNQVVGTRIVAQVSDNGIQLTSPTPPIPPTPPNPVPIKVEPVGGSQAVWDLGLISKGATSSPSTSSGGFDVIQGSDPNPQEVKGMFNSLYRLRDAVRDKDSGGITRAITLLDEDLSRLSLTRGSLGVEQQRIDNLREQQEAAKIELKADESRTFEADIATVISELNARQIAYEASLKLLANAGQISLFNYL